MINGIINAPLSGLPPSVVSPVGPAYRFDGGLYNILSSEDAAYGLQSNFEFAALIKVDSGHPVDQTIFGKYGPPGSPVPDGWRLIFTAASQQFSLSVANSELPNEERCQSVNIELDRWYVVRGNHDGGDARIVVNGVEIVDASFTPGIAAEPFLVGGPVGLRFYGSVSRLTIWNRLLTTAERDTIDGVATNWPFVLG